MAKDWDYAVLAKLANKAGGPQKLIDSIIDASRRQGKINMIPWLGVALAGGSAITVAVTKLIDCFKNKNKKEIEAEKEELIKGIEQYNKEHANKEKESNM